MEEKIVRKATLYTLSSIQRSILIVSVRLSNLKRTFKRFHLINDQNAKQYWSELYDAGIWDRPKPPDATELNRQIGSLTAFGYLENRGGLNPEAFKDTFELSVSKKAIDEVTRFMQRITNANPEPERDHVISKYKTKFDELLEQLIRNGDSKPLYSIAGEFGLTDPLLHHQDIWMFTYKSKAYAKIGGLVRNNNAFNVLMIIPESEGHTFYYEMAYVAKQRLSVYPKIKFDVTAPRKDSDFKEICSILEEGIRIGYDLIAFCAHWTPEEGKDLGEILAIANSKGIKVLMFNDMTPLEGCKIDCKIGYDVTIACQEVSRYMQKLGKGRRFGMLEGTEGQINTQRRNGLLGNLGEDSRLCDRVNAGWSSFTAEDKSERFASTEIGLVTGLSSGMIIGAVRKFEKIKVEGGNAPLCIGWDATIPELELIKQGKLLATVNAFPREQGGLISDAIIKAMGQERMPLETLPALKPHIIDINNVDNFITA